MKLSTVLFILFFLIAYLSIPFSVHLTHETEIYIPYIKYLDAGIIPGFHNNDFNNFSFVFVLGHLMNKVFSLNPKLFFYYLRLFFFILMSFAFTDFILNIAKNNLTPIKNKMTFILIAVIWYIFDWNISYLLIGDEFKSFLAQTFYLLAASSFISRKKWQGFFFVFMSLFSHWAYIILFTLNTFIYFFNRVFKITITKARIVFWFVLSIGLAALYKGIFFYLSPYHYWYLNTANVKKGLVDGFLIRPGVLISTITYLCVMFLLYKNCKKVEENIIVKFSAVMFLILFGFSKYPVIMNSGFIEPARSYIILAPFMALVVAYLLYNKPVKYIFSFIGVQLFVNFILRNFAKETIPFWDIIFKQDFKILFNFILENHQIPQTFFFGVILLFLFFYYYKKYFSEQSMTINFSDILISN